MRLANDDKSSIKLLRQERDGVQKVFVKSFLTRSGQSVLLKIFCARLMRRTRSVGIADSGRPRTVITAQNVKRVAELICSQEDNPGSSKSPREIQKMTGISRSSMRRIAKRDLKLSVFRRKKAQLLSDSDREKRVKCCKTLLRRRCL